MHLPRHDVVVLQRSLVQLEPAIARDRLDCRNQLLASPSIDRLKAFRNGKILAQDRERFHSGDGGGHAGNAHRVAQRLFGSELDVGVMEWRAVAIQRLHAEHRDPALHGIRQHGLLKAAELRVESVDRKLHRIPGVSHVDHLLMNAWIFVTGEAYVADFSLRLARSSASMTPPVRYASSGSLSYTTA